MQAWDTGVLEGAGTGHQMGAGAGHQAAAYGRRHRSPGGIGAATRAVGVPARSTILVQVRAIKDPWVAARATRWGGQSLTGYTSVLSHERSFSVRAAGEQLRCQECERK